MAESEGATADGPEESEIAAFSRALLLRLRDGVEPLAELIGDDLRALLTAHGATVSDQAAALVRDALRDAVPAWVAAHHDQRPLDPDALVPLERLGAGLGAAGLVPEEIEECFGIVIRRTVAYLVDQALASQPSRLVMVGMSLVLLDAVSFALHAAKALARGYTGQQHEALTQRVRAEHELLDDLLSGFFLDGAELVSRGAAIGHDLTVAHGVLLAVVPAAVPNDVGLARLRAVQEALLTRVPGTVDVSLRRSPVPHIAALVPAPTSLDWTRVLTRAAAVTTDHDVVVVAAGPSTGPAVVHTAYQEAARYLELAARVGRPGVVTPRDLIVYRALAGGPVEGRAVVHDVLGPVLARSPNKRAAMLATLEAMRTSNRMIDVARALKLTRKGLTYRIGQIRALTGLDPSDTSQRLQLDVAYRAFQLFGDQPEPEESDDTEGHAPGDDRPG